MPVWDAAGGTVTRPAEHLDPASIFPVDWQKTLTEQVDSYLARGANITFLTFEDVDHMGSACKFFHVDAAQNCLLKQSGA